MQIRRRSPNPAIAVSMLRYQAAVPDSAPNNILEEIVWQKEAEYDLMREKVPLQELRKQVLTAPPTHDFVAALRQGKTKPALIAEVKKLHQVKAFSEKILIQ